MKYPFWILTANSSRATIYQASSHSAPLQEHKVMVNPEARMHTSDLTSDLPGRAFDSAGEGRHIMQQPVDPKQEASIRFAKEISDYLTHALRTEQFDSLYISASPAFLGLLRANFDASLQHAIEAAMDKDLTELPMAEVRARFKAFL